MHCLRLGYHTRPRISDGNLEARTEPSAANRGAVMLRLTEKPLAFSQGSTSLRVYGCRCCRFDCGNWWQGGLGGFGKFSGGFHDLLSEEVRDVRFIAGNGEIGVAILRRGKPRRHRMARALRCLPSASATACLREQKVLPV